MATQHPFLVKKVLYRSKSCEQWGEYELDYVYFAFLKDIGQSINLEEIDAVEWVKREDMASFIQEKESKGEVFTPWFKGIYEKGLMNDWAQFES
jgi:isopentenyldiphosphate isomerase